MKQLQLLIFLFFLFSITSYSEIHEYTFEFIKTIKIGEEAGQIGYNEKVAIAGLPQTPQTFHATDTKIYIPDNVNTRVNIYDINLNFLQEIIEKTPEISNALDMIVDENENIIAKNGHGLVKIDSSGIKRFYIKDHANPGIRHIDLFPIKDNLVFYDKKGYIRMITPDGIIKDSEEAMQFLRQNEKGYSIKALYKSRSLIIDEVRLDKAIQSLENLKKGKKHIIIDDKYYATRMYELKSYYKEIKEYCTLVNELQKSEETNTTDLNSLELISKTFIGYDANHNSYWRCLESKIDTSIMLILSKTGRVVDFFSYKYLVEKQNKCNGCGIYTSVSPNGTLYFMQNDKEGYHFYRVRNTWDTINSTEIPTTSTLPKALSITATSFIDWKNTYTPYRAFDSNLQTGWLEAAKGPGTGESITLTLNKEITVDEIKIAPGYFDPKWWKSNNRVKDLRVIYGNKSLILHFKDVMQMQKAKLNKDIHFSDITFEITGVFPSGKDNDTGISEIEFYYKGEKIEIDVSKVK